MSGIQGLSQLPFLANNLPPLSISSPIKNILPKSIPNILPLNILPDQNINQDINNQDTSDQLNIVSRTRIDTKSSFFATFKDGSSFRNMIEYLRVVDLEGVFRFSEKNILYEKGNSDNTILNVVNIETFELTDYSFKSKNSEIVVCSNMASLRDVTRNIGKKDQLDLYKLENEPNNLYIRPGESDNAHRESMTSKEYDVYTLPEYKRKYNNPTCTIYQNCFAKLCKALVNTKCVHLSVHGFKNGIICKGIKNTGEIGYVGEFGKCNNTSQKTLKSFYPSEKTALIKASVPPPRLNIRKLGEIEKFTIDIKIIKYLQKLNALSPTGTIKMYIEKGLPLKMICNIGSFGKLTTYLMG